jgi:hypothetical protein
MQDFNDKLSTDFFQFLLDFRLREGRVMAESAHCKL